MPPPTPPPCRNSPCAMESEIKDIHRSVCGDEVHGHRGLVKRVTTLEYWAIFIAVYCLMVAGGALAAWHFIEPILETAQSISLVKSTPKGN